MAAVANTAAAATSAGAVVTAFFCFRIETKCFSWLSFPYQPYSFDGTSILVVYMYSFMCSFVLIVTEPFL